MTQRPTKIQKAILDVLYSEGLNDRNLEILRDRLSTLSVASNSYKILMNKIIKLVEKHFDTEIIEIHFKYDTAPAREKYYIKRFDSFRNGLNSNKGGTYGKYISVPIYDMVFLISMGFNAKQITKMINKFYDDIHETTIGERIKQFFGGSFYSAQQRYLKPIIEELLYREGYSRIDILNMFQK